MELSDKEINQRMHLIALQKSRTSMMQEDYDRLKYLNKKDLHNNCKNPQCIGYEGSELETNCPYCKGELFKLIKP